MTGILLSFILFTGCSGPEQLGDEGPYFDTRAFFENKIGELQGKTVYKLVSAEEYDLTGSPDEIRQRLDQITTTDPLSRVDSASLRAELAFFQEYDLAHPSRLGQYKIRNNPSTEGKARIFISTSEKSSPDAVVIMRNPSGEITWISIADESENLLFGSKKVMMYDNVNDSWTINYRQTSDLQDDIYYGVHVRTEVP